MQEKEIIVTNMSSKDITPPAGATWKKFTVYQIVGNDGITYETTDRDFAKTLVLGKSVKIKFHIETKNKNNRVYTSYKIDLPKKTDPAIGQLKEELISLIKMVEKNIISAVKLHTTKAAAPAAPEVAAINPEQPSLFPDGEDDIHYPEGGEDEPDY